jgi:hypothetical protein
VVASPVALLQPTFLVIASCLFFLRIFPGLVRLGAQLAERHPSAVPTLAIAQLSRAPRQAVRIILLLALTTTFCVFTLVFTATQAQHARDVMDHQVGADFGGSIPAPASFLLSAEQMSARYRAISGVLAASPGYVNQVPPNGLGQDFTVDILAVDSRTYAQTAIWTNLDAAQPLSSLLRQLTEGGGVSAGKAVPAIVDALTWNTLRLSPGKQFTLGDEANTQFLAVAEVLHLPTVEDALDTPDAESSPAHGGILVDYRAYDAYYAAAQKANSLPLNYIWLRTRDDQASLASVRGALTAGPLQLTSLLDRRAFTQQMQQDPLNLTLLGVLQLGTVTALLLTLLGTLIASWLYVLSRLKQLIVLRALGATSEQIARVLLWEQGLIYTTALVLGLAFGALLSAVSAPSLSFLGLPNGGDSSSTEFYILQRVVPAQLVLPPSLPLVLAALVAVCALALWGIAQSASRPELGQALRLNED